jgi:hypothetical protein
LAQTHWNLTNSRHFIFRRQCLPFFMCRLIPHLSFISEFSGVLPQHDFKFSLWNTNKMIGVICQQWYGEDRVEILGEIILIHFYFNKIQVVSLTLILFLFFLIFLFTYSHVCTLFGSFLPPPPPSPPTPLASRQNLFCPYL